MMHSVPRTFSPSSLRITRSTPCVEGCCGPMLRTNSVESRKVGDGLAFEDLKRLQPFLGHPVGLALDLRQLAHNLARDALASTQLTLLVLDDRAGLGDPGAICRGHLTPRCGCSANPVL